MKTTVSASFLILLFSLASLNTAMTRKGQYDEVARAQEQLEKQQKKSQSSASRNNPAEGIAEGLKEATVDSTKELLEETADQTKNEAPIVGTLEGAKDGGSKAVETAAKGVFKVATLGYGDPSTMKVQEPEKDSGDVTKFTFKL